MATNQENSPNTVKDDSTKPSPIEIQVAKEEQKHVKLRKPVSGVKKVFQSRSPRTPSSKKLGKEKNVQAWGKPKSTSPNKSPSKLISNLKQKALQSSWITIISKSIQWIVFIVLCLIAGLFTKDVIQQFEAKDKFMGQSLKNITRLPTVVICLDTSWPLTLNKDFGIRYEVTMMTNAYHDLEYYIWLEEKKSNFMENVNETVMVERIGERCFKVNSTIDSTYQQFRKRDFLFLFESNFVESETIKGATMFFTSEENHYGVFTGEWFDGKAYHLHVPLSKWKNVHFTPVEYQYQDHDFQCSHKTFLEQWKMGTFLEADLSNVSKKCAPLSFLESDELGIHPCITSPDDDYDTVVDNYWNRKDGERL